MNIVLTGGTGFIGASVVKQIIRDGNKPVLLLRENSKLERLNSTAGVEYLVYADLMDPSICKKLLKYNAECFIHLAWKGVKGRDRNEKYQVTENIPFTLQSVELATNIGCKQWVGIGSQAEYGNPNRKINEDFPTNPTTLYGKAKLAACWASLGLGDALGIISSWIRVFSTYGVDDDPEWFIPYIISQLKTGNSPDLTKCEQLWDYLFVEDAAKAILSIAYSKAGGIFNIGTGNAIPLTEIVNTIKEAFNPGIEINYGKVPYRPDQVMHLEADVSKIYNATGWKYSTGIREGIYQILSEK